MKLSSLVESGAKDLGIRFNLLNVFPSVLLFVFLLTLFWSGAPSNAPELRPVFEKVEGLGAKDGIVLALIILGFALVMQPLQLSLIKFLEGYWQTPLVPMVGHILSFLGTAWHTYRRQKLKEARQKPPALKDITPEEKNRKAVADWELQRRYPLPDRILPTALGNALRAAEDIPQKRYGLDGVVIWSRLYPLLPEKMVAILSDHRNQLDVAARLCSVFFIAALVSAIVLFKYQW